MKIAFVVGDDLASNVRVRRQARTLAAAGHRVTVYGVSSPETEDEEEEAGVVYVRVRVPRRSSLGFVGWFDRFRRVAEVAASREVPEALHAADLDVALPTQDAAEALDVPFVLDVAGAAYADRLEVRPAPALSVLRRKADALERKLRRRGVAAVLADTSAVADDIVRRYGGPRPAVVRSCAPLAVVKRSDALRRAVGAHPKDRLLVLLGPTLNGCGLEAAVRALRLLGGRHVLVVLGRVPHVTRIERMAEAAGVAGQVRFLAPTSDAERARLAASAEVALVPTEPNCAANRLGVPSRFYDALAFGLPVVASDTAEVGAVVRRTRAGVLYAARSPQDPAALAEGVHTLTSDGALLATCAEASARAAGDEFNWEIESLKLIDVYDAVSA